MEWPCPLRGAVPAAETTVSRLLDASFRPATTSPPSTFHHLPSLHLHPFTSGLVTLGSRRLGPAPAWITLTRRLRNARPPHVRQAHPSDTNMRTRKCKQAEARACLLQGSACSGKHRRAVKNVFGVISDSLRSEETHGHVTFCS